MSSVRVTRKIKRILWSAKASCISGQKSGKVPSYPDGIWPTRVRGTAGQPRSISQISQFGTGFGMWIGEWLAGQMDTRMVDWACIRQTSKGTWQRLKDHSHSFHNWGLAFGADRIGQNRVQKNAARGGVKSHPKIGHNSSSSGGLDSPLCHLNGSRSPVSGRCAWAYAEGPLYVRAHRISDYLHKALRSHCSISLFVPIWIFDSIWFHVFWIIHRAGKRGRTWKKKMSTQVGITCVIPDGDIRPPKSQQDNIRTFVWI